MFKIAMFVVGVFFCSVGLMFMILYLNLLTIGYSFFEFVKFISSRGECLIFLLGVILIVCSFERWIRNELLLRYSHKFK